MKKKKARFHLPGLFEFYEFYKAFLPLFTEHTEYFYDWVEIASIYGEPGGCIWAGGRFEAGGSSAHEVLALLERYGISARLTFSNSLLQEEHLADKKCNALCEAFECGISESKRRTSMSRHATATKNGVIVHSDLLVDYLKEHYPNLYLVSSTTKVLTNFSELERELQREEFSYVVPDFRLNKNFERLNALPQELKDKVEFLCNECCFVGCTKRKECYENVSRRMLGEDCPEHICTSPYGDEGYRFSRAMQSPAFIGKDDIEKVYLPNGFTNFKIEGRGLGSAMLLEFILHYMVKPECQIIVREELYLDSMLDLF